MKTRNRDSSRAFLAGALAGAVVALLFAPAPGRETRASVRTTLQQTTSEARELGERIGRTGRRVLHGAADAIEKVTRR
jgi:gas vesicle protein